MQNENLNQILQQLKQFMPNYCDKCGARYDNNDLEVLQNDKNRTVCKLTCKKCNNGFVMHVNPVFDGIFSAKPIGGINDFKDDLSKEEKNKFQESEYINSDEIIDVFTSLQKISNIEDFNSLFSKN